MKLMAMNARSIATWRPFGRRVPRRAIRRGMLMAAIFLTLGLLARASPVHEASASLGGCRSDPVVILSNGGVVRMTVNIADNSSDVQQVAYTIHAPVGTTISHIYYTGSGLPESVQLIADETSNITYDTDTVVSTGASGVAVVATTLVIVPSASQPLSGWGSDSGQSQQDLPVHIVLGPDQNAGSNTGQ